MPCETLLCKKMEVYVGKVFLTLLLNLMVYIKIVCFALHTGLIKILHVCIVCFARKISLSVCLMNLSLKESHNGSGSGVEHLPRVCDALGLNPRVHRKEGRKGGKKGEK